MEKDNSNNTKEKMLKSCERLNKVIIGFVYGLAAMMIILAVIGFIMSIALSAFPSNEAKTDVGSKYLETTEKIGNTMENLMDKVDQIQKMKSENGIITTITVILSWSILFNISTMLKNTVNKKTPFSEENVRCMKLISIISTLLWIITTSFIINVGLIFVLAIDVMYYIFKYGYQLQIESDETL